MKDRVLLGSHPAEAVGAAATQAAAGLKLPTIRALPIMNVLPGKVRQQEACCCLWVTKPARSIMGAVFYPIQRFLTFIAGDRRSGCDRKSHRAPATRCATWS